MFALLLFPKPLPFSCFFEGESSRHFVKWECSSEYKFVLGINKPNGDDKNLNRQSYGQVMCFLCKKKDPKQSSWSRIGPEQGPK
jgi:hypothetical protein